MSTGIGDSALLCPYQVHEWREDVDDRRTQRGSHQAHDQAHVLAEEREPRGTTQEEDRGEEPGRGVLAVGVGEDVEEGVPQAREEEGVGSDDGDGRCHTPESRQHVLRDVVVVEDQALGGQAESREAQGHDDDVDEGGGTHRGGDH